MKFRELVHEEDAKGGTTADVADRIIARLLTEQPGLAARLLAAPVYDEVRRVRRQAVRRRENQAFGADPDDGNTDDAASTEDPLAPYRQLCEDTFYDPVSGEYVTWQDATADQHEAYAQFCEMQSAALLTTASRHRGAMALIAAHSVKRLADIPGF